LRDWQTPDRQQGKTRTNQRRLMKHFRLFTSNRLEILSRLLAGAILETHPDSPLEKEIIVVQSQGMKRWVSMELAKYHGICANVEFCFPNDFIYEMFQKVFPELPDQSAYDPEVMTWEIMKALPMCIEHPEFKHLRNYLQGSAASLRQFQVAERIAGLFDQYLIFRPKMILEWEKGKDTNWQALLWQTLTKDHTEKHRPALAAAFLKAIQKDFSFPSSHASFPKRVSVFGISSLPEFHIQMFDAISHFSEVNLFLMNPCEPYWVDILSDREIRRAAAGHSDRSQLHLDQGNSLLGSMGMLGRDFFGLIYNSDLEEHPFFAQPGEDSLLMSIQSDIVNLREQAAESDAKTKISEADNSVQIHSCHSPMRETEVLHDHILEMFKQDPELRPGDILVMMPDIETYAPYVQAVFDLPRDDPRRIPFSIADRSVRVESRIIDTFLRILDLTGSRFGAAQIFSVLEYPAVYQRFDLTESELDMIRRWVRDSGIRWGIDGDSRKNMGLPGLPENTWKAGLDRLLLGYAMPGGEERMFSGILPYDLIEGGDAAALGKFVEFTDRLFSGVQSLESLQTIKEWGNTLRGILEEFFKPDESTENEIQTVRQVLNDLNEMQTHSGFDEKTDIHVMRYFLSSRLQQKGFGFGFITGGITFCAMLPMRSIPFKVICLVGMNTNVYPRQSRPPDFDLMAKKPRAGDPSRRNDDRYLFLESLLSAREKLYISYVGQSIRDNSTMPPSVLVSELMDYIEKGFEIPEKKIVEDHILLRHRLQAFSPAYFESPEPDPEKLFSYSRENLDAAKCLLRKRESPVPFISARLSVPEAEWKTISLPDLCLFLNNPAKYLLNRRLGIYFETEESALEENECFDISGLDKYALEQNLLDKKLEGRELDEFFPLKKASGCLPHGTAGFCVYERLRQNVEKFVKSIKPYVEKPRMRPLEVDMSLNGFRLTGRIDAIYPERLVHYRYASVKPKDHLRTWVHHLALNSRNGSGGASANAYPRYSMLAGSDSMWEYVPVKDSEDILMNLLEKYWYALRRPLHFFPKTSWEYASLIIRKKKSPDETLRSVRNAWKGNPRQRGENENAYFQQCFGQTDPLDTEFQETALEIFTPLIEHQRNVA